MKFEILLENKQIRNAFNLRSLDETNPLNIA